MDVDETEDERFRFRELALNNFTGASSSDSLDYKFRLVRNRLYL